VVVVRDSWFVIRGSSFVASACHGSAVACRTEAAEQLCGHLCSRGSSDATRCVVHRRRRVVSRSGDGLSL